MEDLALQIKASTEIIAEYLRSEGHPQPSFDQDAPINMFSRTCPEKVVKSRHTLVEASLQVFQFASGPTELLPNLAVAYQTLSALRWLIHFKIFTHIPLPSHPPDHLGDSISYDDVAYAASVPCSTLKRVTRMVMTAHLFYEPLPSRIAHTTRSALFVTSPNYAHWAEFMVENGMPTAAKLFEATETWGDDGVKNHTAYNLAIGTDLPFFDHLREDKKRSDQFAGYMKAVTDGEGTKLEHLVNGFDWASLGNGGVVDMGGSTGHASFALSAAYPKLRFIVQDLPSVLNQLHPTHHTTHFIPPGQPVIFQPHDFFTRQPLCGASVYLLRMILHDWPKESAIIILRNIIPALAPYSRILIMDTILPAPGEVTSYREARLRVRDLTMLQVFNTGERAMEEWEEVIKEADDKFRIASVHQPLGSAMAIIEVRLDRNETLITT